MTVIEITNQRELPAYPLWMYRGALDACLALCRSRHGEVTKVWKLREFWYMEAG